jgi:hypothetical protein
MAFRDELLADGTSGLTEVAHDGTLTGSGTTAAPIGIADNGVTAGKIATGQVVKSVNGLKDAVTLTAGSNVTITPSGNTLTIAASGGGSGGSITGVTAGTGLSGGGTTGNVTLAVQEPLVLDGNPAFAGATIEGHSTLGRGLLGTTASTHGAVEGFNTGTGPGVWGGSSGGASGYLGGTTTGVEGQASMGAGFGVKGSGGMAGVDGTSPVNGVQGDGGDYGVYGFSSTGLGVGGNGHSGGVRGTSTDYSGVKGESTSGYGVEGHSSSSAGVRGTSTSGYGVVGESANQAGVYGTSSSGAGVLGSSGGGIGVYGQTSSQAGVRGEGDSGDGVAGNSGTGNGVKGTSGSGWAVYGLSASSGHAGLLGTPGYGGDFVGDVRVQGTLSKSAGSFVIDHPLDPEHRYLAHSFVESPDMKNVYDGVVVLDGRGAAVVELPDWFEALNRDFRYQLTCIGGFAPVYVAEEIAGNRFVIAGGRPGLKVSWQVTGVRRDAYAEAHRIVVEQDKPAEEQGTYLYPGLFGQGAEKGVETVRHPALVRDLSSKSSAVAERAPILP